MNPFGSQENVCLDGMIVKFPVAVGDYPSLSSSIIFQRPKWVPDEEAINCLNCGLRFSPIRRKHHCRNCGEIFCSMCCFEKISLPHFGMTEIQRVCNNCKLIAELMLKSKSQNTEMKQEAVMGLSALLSNSAGLSKVIECGGIHIMLAIAIDSDVKVKSSIASALQNITQNMMLNSFLVEVGCLKVIKNFLVSACDNLQIVGDALSTLNLLCMDANTRIEVLKEGMVEVLLSIVSTTGVAAAFASRILTLLVCNFEHLEFIIQSHTNIVPDLFDALQNEDFQMQICITKILVFFSAGSSAARDMIIKEDVRRGFNLLFLLKGSCQVVLVNTVCIVANISLAINESYTHHYITGLCELLNNVDESNEDIIQHLSRGLANFSESTSNAVHILHYLPTIIARLLKCSLETPRLHACRLLLHLLETEMPCTIDALSRSGLEEFIETVFDLPGITDVLSKLILRKVSRLSVSK